VGRPPPLLWLACAGRDAAFGAIVVVIVLAALPGAVVAARFMAPIRVLTNAAVRLGAGDEAAPLPTSGVPEVAELGRQFSQMYRA
jgi:nitrogen fixation/metabolism regulation signal transduction histidine kinase